VVRRSRRQSSIAFVPGSFPARYPAREERRAARGIKIKLGMLRRGRVAALASNKAVLQWLEEAIPEKIDRETKHSKEGQA